MSWTTRKDVIAQLGRLWNRGDLLRDMVADQPRFPLRLVLKRPESVDISDRFDAVRAWVVELMAIPEIRLTWRDVRHRVQGAQRVPAAIWIDSIDDALALLGTKSEWQRFGDVVAATHQLMPELLPWLAHRPLVGVQLADDWHRLLAVISWIRDHPRTGMYLRQVDLP